MKNNFAQRFIYTGIVFLCLLPGFNMLYAQTPNAGFEAGNFTGWRGTYSAHVCSVPYMLGICNGCSATNPLDTVGFNQGPNNDPPSDADHNYSHIITTRAGGNDPNITLLGGTLPMVWPGSGSYSARMGNMWQSVGGDATGDGETTSYSFLVTPVNANFTYHYAVVLNDGTHVAGEQPYFNVAMTDSGGNPIPAASYAVNSTTAQTIGGFNAISAAEIYWKPWTSVLVPLHNYIGQTVTITFTTRGCLPTGCSGTHYAYAYIDAESAPDNILVTSTGGCAAQVATLTAPPGCATYNWTGPGITGATDSAAIHINQPGLYTVTMTTIGAQPDTFSIDTVISVNSNSPVANFSATTVCAGSPTVFTDLSTTQGNFSKWAWDFNNNGVTDDTTQNPTYMFPTAGIYPVKLTVTSSPCTADTTIYVIVATAPTSTFTAVSPVCVGQNSTITYTGSGTGNYIYTWNFLGNSTVSGTGMGPYVVNWTTPGTKNITLTVALGNCSSTVTTIQVVVNATPTSAFTVSGPLCQASSVTITFTGSAGNGAIYTWNFGVGNIVLGSGQGPYQITWPFTGVTYVTLNVSENGCSSSAADTIQIQGCSGIAQIETGGISIYPNPAKNDFTMQVSQPTQSGQIEIYDVLGQCVYRDEIKNEPAGFTRQIHITAAAGVYVVKINDGEKVYTAKVVME